MKTTIKAFEAGKANPRKNVVLLVDADGDSESIVLKAAALTLRDVLLVKTSRHAFGILQNEMRRLDAVIVDVDPGAHGLALLEAISGCAERPPIIVVTALEETYMKPITAEYGATACLGKPIRIETLKSTLDAGSAKKSRTLTCDSPIFCMRLCCTSRQAAQTRFDRAINAQNGL